MNKLFVYVVMLCSVFSSHAQRKGGASREIDAAQIPTAVKSAQESSFPKITVKNWSMRNVTGPGQIISKYIAVFESEGKTIRARYKGDGTLVSSSKYFAAAQAPSVIKNLGSKYNDQELKSAEEIKTYVKAKVFYRAHFYKGKKKIVVYVDDNGKELPIEKVPAEAKEDEEVES